MTRLIAFFTPRRWWDWPFGIVFWGVVASVIAFLVEYILDGGTDDPLLKHFATTTLVAAPLIVMGMLMFRHLDRLQRELTVIASTDPLTGMLNRRAFLSEAEKAGTGALLMMDLDYFKSVNDSYGHTVGDDVLMLTAQMLQSSVRKTDLAGRLGGEEFAIFLPGTRKSVAAEIGAELAVGVTYENGDLSFCVTASVGCAVLLANGHILHALNEADQALYLAKEAGRARFMFYRPASDDAAVMQTHGSHDT